jgi:hypothetical protein
VFYLVRVVPETRKRVWVKLGDASALSLEGARKAAEKVAGTIAQGVDPNEERPKARAVAQAAKQAARANAGEPSVGDLVLRYIKAKEPRLSDRTCEEYLRLRQRNGVARSVAEEGQQASDKGGYPDHREKRRSCDPPLASIPLHPTGPPANRRTQSLERRPLADHLARSGPGKTKLCCLQPLEFRAPLEPGISQD